MKTIKDFLKKIDVFGSTFNFKYKSKDKYSTYIGGLFVLLFLILSSYTVIYYFIPFSKRKNYTILYYTMNLPYTESIKFKDTNIAFAIGLICDEKEGLNMTRDQLLKLEIKYILDIKDFNGSNSKNKTFLSYHPCEQADFYYKYKDSVDYFDLKNYQCLDDYGHNIKGIYSDQIFSYYEFTVLAKDLKNETFNKIDEYLFNTDCKLQILYTDTTINLDNYKQPINHFLNSAFIQINPTLFIKRNMYYMNQYLEDDDLLFGIFDEETLESKKETLYSRYEEYSLYLGLNRFSKKFKNYENYAKLFIRADTKKMKIRRTYQKLFGFIADVFSLLFIIYKFLFLLLNYTNNFYSEYILGKKIFFFKELNDNPFLISKKYEQIKELLSLNTKKEFKNLDIYSNVNDSRQKYNKTILFSKNEIKIYNQKNKRFTIDKNKFGKNILKENTEIKRKKTPILKTKEVKSSDSTFPSKEIEEDSKIKNSNNFINLNPNPIIKNFINFDSDKIDNIKKNNNYKKENIKYSFNGFEIILSSFCKIFRLSKNLELKVDFKEKATNILNTKLDIILYIRNMILFDIMNETILSESNKDIINFLSRPTLEINKVIKNKYSSIYQSFKEEDFDNFLNGYKELIKQPNKNERDLKLISLSEQKLKDLIEGDKPI